MQRSNDLVPKRTLSPDELEVFQRDGLLTDFQLFSTERAATIRAALLREVLALPSTAPCHQQFPPEERLDFDRHLDRRLIYELCTLPQIMRPIMQILGGDVMVFRSQFFNKPPRGREIPWHQESYFWRVEPEWVTLWLAIDDASRDNGMMRLIPGSHTSTREHPLLPPDSNYWSTFPRMAHPRPSDRIVPCAMPAGHFMLFGDLLHSSLPNTTLRPRLSFTARYARPDLAGVHDHTYADHQCVMVSGRAGDSSLRFVPPPDSGPGLAEL